jgi:hypothetical protein
MTSVSALTSPVRDRGLPVSVLSHSVCVDSGLGARAGGGGFATDLSASVAKGPGLRASREKIVM